MSAREMKRVEAMQMDPSITTYGDKNPRSPNELAAFSFLVGKWQGEGKARLPDGAVADFPVSWVGRYILDGTAIADEMHSVNPDGSPYLGISLRQYDPGGKTWIIEYLNVSNSFLRRQVNGRSGSVDVDGRNVTVVSEGPTTSREHYRVVDEDHWVYRIDLSSDGGRSWNEAQVEMTFRRSEGI
jgi:hypothetical protein